MIPPCFTKFIILTVGILHPGYASFKSIRTKSMDNYVNWMIYWIIFSAFCTIEYIVDSFFQWFPLYQEIKLLLLFWLLPSHNNGSAIIYRHLIYPFLIHHEIEIDAFLEYIRYQGYGAFMMVSRQFIVCAYQYLTEFVQRNWPISLMPPSKTQILALPAVNAIGPLLVPLAITELPEKTSNVWSMGERNSDNESEDINIVYDLNTFLYHEPKILTSESLHKRRDQSVGSTKSLNIPKSRQTNRRVNRHTSR